MCFPYLDLWVTVIGYLESVKLDKEALHNILQSDFVRVFICSTMMTIVVVVNVVSAPLSCWSKSGQVTSVDELSVTDTASPQSSCHGVCYVRLTMETSAIGELRSACR